jgi:hypothetical protein
MASTPTTKARGARKKKGDILEAAEQIMAGREREYPGLNTALPQVARQIGEAISSINVTLPTGETAELKIEPVTIQTTPPEPADPGMPSLDSLAILRRRAIFMNQPSMSGAYYVVEGPPVYAPSSPGSAPAPAPTEETALAPRPEVPVHEGEVVGPELAPYNLPASLEVECYVCDISRSFGCGSFGMRDYHGHRFQQLDGRRGEPFEAEVDLRPAPRSWHRYGEHSVRVRVSGYEDELQALTRRARPGQKVRIKFELVDE